MYKYQLLYVYTNDYQAGGFMWFAVYDRSLFALICGCLTLLGYLSLRLAKSLDNKPFYALVPLPFLIYYFWRHTRSKFKRECLELSLEESIEVDSRTQSQSENFNRNLYSQPSLNEGRLGPEEYRGERSLYYYFT